MSNNDHLNVFKPYTQADSLIENNISRGWAILLQEEPGLFLMMLNKVNEYLQKKRSNTYVIEPQDEYEVCFQKRCGQLASDIGSIDTIIGIALTSSKIDNIIYDQNVINGADDPITDISIAFDDTLIIIEAKRDNTDCSEQLNDQINKFKSYFSDNGNDIAGVKVEVVSSTWSEVLTIVRRYKSFKGDSPNRLLDDYFEIVTKEHPEWSPCEQLSKLNIEDKKRIELRLEAVKKEYMNLYHNGQALIYKRNVIPLSVGWASEYSIYIKDDLYDHNGEVNQYFVMGVWPADTCGQFWSLNKLNNPEQFLAKRFFAINVSGEIINVKVTPYIKFCHCQRWVMDLSSEISIQDNDNHIDDLFVLAKKIMGKNNRGKDWDDLIKDIAESNLYNEETIESFKIKFEENFTNSGRNYATVSVGFEVLAYVKFDRVQKIDTDLNNLQPMAEYIHDVFEKIKYELEK